jgi:hypothetical protein
MPTFKLPLSGDVVQSISPWTAFMSPIGNQFGLVNITIGQSSDPSVEADVLSDVGSYGKQLGRIGDALAVLLAHFHPHTPLTKEETDAIDDLKEMLAGIADVKQKHGRPVMRPRGAAAPDSVSLAPPQGPANAPPPPTAAPKPPPARPAARPRGRS